MASKICDFCLREYKGPFRRLRKLEDGHLICGSCAKVLEDYGLPAAYDLFQLLVLAPPEMRDVIMSDYLESHSPQEVMTRFFPAGDMPLHKGETLITQRPASITVEESLVPAESRQVEIRTITKKDVLNLYDAPKGKAWPGTLYETNAALYFIADRFVNVHRLTNIIKNHEDTKAVHVLEHGQEYTYALPHADLFFMRDAFFTRTQAALKNKKDSLIYLSSENTMTLTPGIYSVPANVRSGSYYVNPVGDSTISVRDAFGRRVPITDGRLQLDEGSSIEVTGSYQFRFQKHEDRKNGLSDTKTKKVLDTGDLERTKKIK
jgi:hypothetical protein